MPPPFTSHPQRAVIAAEIHSRPYEPMRAPERVSHIAYLSGEKGLGLNFQHLERLFEHFGVPAPTHRARHHFADLGPVRMRWERHTEFVTYTFFQQGPFLHPFADPPVSLVPEEWLASLPGEIIAAVTLALESRDMHERGLAEIATLFDGNTVIGCNTAGGAGKAWSDMRIHRDGYSRILARDVDLSERQAGRMTQRLLELNAYRTMALLALPLAREVGPCLQVADHRLAVVAARLADHGGEVTGSATDRELLDELSKLASEVEAVAARTSYRFGGARAYYGVVRQRLFDLRQQRIEGLQTFSEFLDTRLVPAINTCNSTDARQKDLAERAARLTSLLRARVEVELEEQNRGLLESMNRRAHLQLRLQETVEGLSVVAISYYGVSLIGYAFKGLKEAGLPIDPALAMALAVPVVVGATWLGLKRMKKRLHEKAVAEGC